MTDDYRAIRTGLEQVQNGMLSNTIFHKHLTINHLAWPMNIIIIII